MVSLMYEMYKFLLLCTHFTLLCMVILVENADINRSAQQFNYVVNRQSSVLLHAVRMAAAPAVTSGTFSLKEAMGFPSALKWHPFNSFLLQARSWGNVYLCETLSSVPLHDTEFSSPYFKANIARAKRCIFVRGRLKPRSMNKVICVCLNMQQYVFTSSKKDKHGNAQISLLNKAARGWSPHVY